jgi:hypothetical protein
MKEIKLPKLICLNDYGGNWSRYLEILYDAFKQDFINSKTKFKKRELSLKKHPVINGKEATFWHIITEGKIEKERTPDLRKCERIKWPKPIIENDNASNVKCWENERKGEKRVCLCFGNWEYLVVLAKRKSYILIWTAYPVTYTHTKRKLKREYEKYFKKANTAS